MTNHAGTVKPLVDLYEQFRTAQVWQISSLYCLVTLVTLDSSIITSSHTRNVQVSGDHLPPKLSDYCAQKLQM